MTAMIALPLVYGWMLVAAVAAVRVAWLCATAAQLPNPGTAGLPGAVACLLLVRPLNWPGLWLLGLPVYHAVRLWGGSP